MGVAWPIALQDKLNEEGFGYSPGDTVLRSDNEIGPQKMRRRYTKSVDSMSCTIRVDRALHATFMNFYNISTNGGVLPFNFVNPITLANDLWRFLDTPTTRSIGGGYFVISMNWEKQP